jgi:hypothetical protein
MLLTVEGAYRDGEIELAEIPENVEQADVLVTFLKTKKNPGTPPPSVSSPKPRLMTFGQFAGETKINEEDFRLAEWRGEPECERG